MKINSLVDIVEGKLLNSPAISFVTQMHTDINKVNDGDAYFCTNLSNIKKAVSKGAFALICEIDLLEKIDIESIDNEIAWIVVDNLEKAILKLLRYNLVQKNNKYINVDIVSYFLIDCFKTRDMDDIVLLKNNIFDDFEILNSIDDRTSYIFGTNQEFLEYISTETLCIKRKSYHIKNLSTHSLFETSFSNKDIYFEKIKLPYVYINNLLQLLEYFPHKIDIKRLNSFELFKPIFINKVAQIVSYGQTNRFILANENFGISDIEVAYLKKHYKYATIKVIHFADYDEEELYNTIKNTKYNALYIVGISSKKIINLLEKKDFSDTLF